MKQAERGFFIIGYKNEIESLKNLLPHNSFADDLESIINRIIVEFDASMCQADIKKTLEDLLERKKRELNGLEIKNEGTQREINELLTSVSANDMGEFLKKYEKNNRVKELNNERSSAVNTIEKIVGLNKFTDVKEFWGLNEKDQIEAYKIEKENKLKLMEDENNLKNSELGEKKTEIKRIEGESELALILTEVESEKQKLNNKYKDWLVGKLALKILESVKKKYETERQPAVIKSSSKYFDDITQGKYVRMSASLEDKDVSIFDSKERSKRLLQMSRGTKEQLLISLRLGFIEEYEKASEPLPLIVDEVLVNFDPARAKQTAKTLYDFALNRQVLIFTCHPTTKEYFENLKVNIIEI
jgi:uncharacterized protein YhaN